MKLFYSIREWWEYLISAIRGMCVGFLKILCSIVMGIASIFSYIGRSVNAFARREPKAMLVIVLLLLTIGAGWLLNFVNERSMRVTAERERDSLSLKLDSAKQNSMVRARPLIDNHWNVQ